MKPAETEEMSIRHESGATRIVLPRRRLGKVTNGLTITLFVIGTIVTVFMLSWVGGSILNGIRETGPGKWFGIAFGLMGLPGLIMGLGMLVAAVALRSGAGRGEILVTRDTITATDYLGPFHWTRKRPLKSVVRFVVSDISQRTKSNDGTSVRPSTGIGGIMAECEGRKGMLVALFYPMDLMRTLAGELSHAGGGAGKPLIAKASAPAIPVVERSADGDDPASDYPKPVDTDISFKQLDNGLALVVPPRGIWKGSKGLFFFSIIWIGFVAFMATMAFTSSTQGEKSLFVFLGVFLLIGVGMMLGAINMGRRKSMLAVVGDSFAIRRTGIFGTKEQILKLSEISGIRMGPSGTEVNDVPIMELQIHRKDGKKIGIWTERTNDELMWLASELRKALGVPSGIMRKL